MACTGNDVDAAFGEAELGQGLDPVARIRWLLERPPQVRDSRVGRAPGERAGCGLAQGRDDEVISTRRHELEMTRGPLRCSTALHDLARGAPVREHALGGIDRLVHGCAHDRVRELDVRRPQAKQIGATKRGRGMGRHVEVELGELCDPAELRPVAEDGRGTCEPRGLCRQPRQTQRDGARHRLGTDLQNSVGVAGHWSQPLGDDGSEQRVHKKRVAARRRQTGLGEGALRPPCELLGGELDHRLDPERVRADQHRRRIGEKLGQKLGLLALLRRPQPDDDREGQTFEPARDVGEPAQGRPVRPMQIVDRDHGRAAQRHVRRQPVETVQHPERDIAFLRDQLALGEEPLGERSRAAEQLAPQLRSGGRDQWLEELAEDAVGEVLLELGAARVENLEARLLGDRAGFGDEPGLPHAGPALDRDDTPRPTGGESDRLLDRGQFGLALEQRWPYGADGDGRPAFPQARAERRERVRKPWHDELVEPLGPLEVRHVRLTEVSQLDAVNEIVLDQARRRAREQHLAALADVADARGLVDGEADVAVAACDRLAGVQAHSHLHLVAREPRLGGKCGLRRGGSRDGGTRAAEDGEEGIALAVDLDSAGRPKGLLEQAVVGRQELRVAVAAELLQQPRRAFDVREQESDGAGWELLRSFAQVLTPYLVELALPTGV